MERRCLMLSSVGVLFLPSLFWGGGCQQKPIEVNQAQAVEKEVPVAQSNMKRSAFQPQVAGQFYPADPSQLRKMIQSFLNEAKRAGKTVAGDLLGIIVPHAGYPYSGPVAAFSFQALSGRTYKRVVVLGPSHQRFFDLPALLDASSYNTPLGDIPIDQEGVSRLAATGAARVERAKFEGEHALEVELPFLQVVLSEFELVPIMISEPSPDSARRLAAALKETFPAKDTLFVASTDMSHDYPYDVAVAMDQNALRLIQGLDAAGLFSAYQLYRRAEANIRLGKDGRPDPDCTQLCGMGPVLTLLELAKMFGEAKVAVLDRRTSGDIVGDRKSRIVGYGAVAISTAVDRPEGKAQPSRAGATRDFLKPEEKQELLKIARKTLDAYVKNGETSDFQPAFPKLKEPGAAFVTLKKRGELRGCIGHMEPTDPLWRMIRDRAIDAAANDPRFGPVKAEELAEIAIEISVLSPRVPVKEPLKEIEIGRDGVWLELGFSRGVFLPQVPVEQGWRTVEEYLDHLCQKAGVFRSGCWKSPEARIMRFTALVFSESEK